jgi:hypothetical protein
MDSSNAGHRPAAAIIGIGRDARTAPSTPEALRTGRWRTWKKGLTWLKNLLRKAGQGLREIRLCTAVTGMTSVPREVRGRPGFHQGFTDKCLIPWT